MFYREFYIKAIFVINLSVLKVPSIPLQFAEDFVANTLKQI
jgi:hypothetical protein